MAVRPVLTTFSGTVPTTSDPANFPTNADQMLAFINEVPAEVNEFGEWLETTGLTSQVGEVAGHVGVVTAAQLVTAIDAEANANILRDAEKAKLDNLYFGIANFAALSTLTYADYPVGSVLEVDGHLYDVVAAGTPDIHLAYAGINLNVREKLGGYDVDAFGPDGTRAGDSAAIKAAVEAANGAPVRLGYRRYYWDGTSIDKTTVTIWGAGIPQVNSGMTALEKGSIIDGTFTLTGLRVDLRDFGVDVGPDSSAPDGNGLVATTVINSGIHLHTENLIALGKTSTSAFHALLFQSYLKHTGGNIEGVLTSLGVVIKCQNVYLDSVRSKQNSSVGVFFKSDTPTGRCGDIIVNQISAEAIAGQLEGVKFQSSDDAMRRVNIGKIKSIGSRKNVTVQLAGTGTELRDINLGSIYSRNAEDIDLSIECNNSAGSMFNIGYEKLVTADTVARGLSVTGTGVVRGLNVGETFINYRSAATQAEMDNGVLIEGVCEYTNIPDLTICRNYSLNTLGGITYNNTRENNILGTRRCRVFGAGRPENGTSTITTTTATADITVPFNVDGSGRSLLRIDPTVDLTVTSLEFPVVGGEDFDFGHILTIINNSNSGPDTVTVPSNAGGNVINKGGLDVVIQRNETASWVFGGSLWHEMS